jgi:hypothetical protein
MGRHICILPKRLNVLRLEIHDLDYESTELICETGVRQRR